MSGGSMVVLNGELLPRSGARIGVDDAGFLRGDGVFETVRADSGAPLLLDAHVARLERSLAAVGIAIPWRPLDLRDQVDLVLGGNALQSGTARVRITVTRGANAPTVLVTADPYDPPPPEVYEHGVEVGVSPYVRRPHPLHRVKSTSCAAALWLRREASTAGAFEILQFNDAGLLAEGGFTNVFAVDAGGTLRTPAPEEGCLEGVTRGAVIALAARRSMTVEAGGIDRGRLEAAIEIFLTGSLVEVVPVQSVAGRAVAPSCPGPVTRALAQDYAAHVRGNA